VLLALIDVRADAPHPREAAADSKDYPLTARRPHSRLPASSSVGARGAGRHAPGSRGSRLPAGAAEARPRVRVGGRAVGDKSYRLGVAASERARRYGLRNRESMPADRGMIFVFRRGAAAGRSG